MDLWRIMDHQTHSRNDVESSNARSPRDPDGVGDEGSQTLEEERAVFGEAFRHGFPHAAMMQSRDRQLAVVSGSAGTSILNDSSFPASFTRDPRGPFPPLHVNQFEYRNSHRSQRSDRHYSTAMPVYPYPRAPSEFVDYRLVDRQRRSANFEMTIPNEYHRDDSHTRRPEVVVPTLCTSGRFKEPLEGNVFAHGGSLKRSPHTQYLEHARSMASKSGTMEHDSCREMVRELEEVSSNMSTLTRRPSILPTHPTEPESSREHTTLLPRAFKVSASLKAAAASTVFPTPCGERTNVADFVTFITAVDPQAVPIKCKLCEQDIARKESLVHHWIRVHAFADLQVALMYPHGDHSDLVINTTQRRDILLAALYTCPLKGCRGSTVGVYVTKGDLLRHVRRHHGFLDEASEEENARDTEVELEQMREQVTNYLNNHTFWLPVDRTHFTSRNYKLAWLLNQ
ncbi:hypothetical protein BU17DRAFT_85209 [Hysterangium stoloniferum]|nr:hypothetical protein BU17DRAFT_85209 [Hysterangium stoloniferum]